MDSLNLNNLATSLPNSNLANAEKDLLNNFKAAALSVATLYRSSRRTYKRAYNAGYAAACNDLLFMIQQGVSLSGSSPASSSTPSEAATIGRIMDYVEARLEAIRTREEEEDEDEEREKDKERRPASTAIAGPSIPKASASSNLLSAPRTNGKTSQLPSNAEDTPQVPPRSRDQMSQLSDDSSPPISPFIRPSFPPPTTIPSSSHFHRQATKAKLAAFSNSAPSTTGAADIIPLAPSPTGFFHPEPPVAIFPPSPVATPEAPATTGTKRRLAAMLDASSPPNTPTPTKSNTSSSRRRTRSTRALMLASQNSNQSMGRETGGTDAMDVEEEGREKKRVTRR